MRSKRRNASLREPNLEALERQTLQYMTDATTFLDAIEPAMRELDAHEEARVARPGQENEVRIHYAKTLNARRAELQKIADCMKTCFRSLGDWDRRVKALR